MLHKIFIIYLNLKHDFIKKVYSPPPFVILLLFFGLVFQSCEKEESLTLASTPNLSLSIEGTSVQNGILVFDNWDNYFKGIKIIEDGDFQNSELDQWEKLLGFTSIRKKYDNILSELENSATNEDAETIIQQNKDLINPVDLSLKVNSLYTVPFLNENGIIKVGKFYYKYSDKAQIMSQDYSEVLRANELTETSKSLFVNKYEESNISLRTGCSNTGYKFVRHGHYASRISYRLNRDDRPITREVCSKEWEYDFKTNKWKSKEVCKDEVIAVSALLSFKTEGRPYRRWLWSWHTTRKNLTLSGNVELKINGTSFRKSLNSRRRGNYIRKTATFPMNGGQTYYIDEINTRFKHDDGSTISITCN